MTVSDSAAAITGAAGLTLAAAVQDRRIARSRRCST
jgi:hypothetical protein